MEDFQLWEQELSISTELKPIDIPLPLNTQQEHQIIINNYVQQSPFRLFNIVFYLLFFGGIALLTYLIGMGIFYLCLLV